MSTLREYYYDPDCIISPTISLQPPLEAFLSLLLIQGQRIPHSFSSYNQRTLVGLISPLTNKDDCSIGIHVDVLDTLQPLRKTLGEHIA